jgi:hypothetical protein
VNAARERRNPTRAGSTGHGVSADVPGVRFPARKALEEFDFDHQWVARLVAAHQQGRLQAEITKLGRVPLLIVDEIGYIPFEAEAANVFFQVVSARYERASLIVSSNKPFGRWGEVFGDDVVAAAVIDRLRNRDLGRIPAAKNDT